MKKISGGFLPVRSRDLCCTQRSFAWSLSFAAVISVNRCLISPFEGAEGGESTICLKTGRRTPDDDDDCVKSFPSAPHEGVID